MNRVLTTGQVARIFSVNINTVIKWFDEGKLPGFRLPRSNERRIYRESVVTFMKEHDISDGLLAAFEETQSARRRGRRSTKDGEGTTPTPPATGNGNGQAAKGEEHRFFPRKPVDLHAVLDGEALAQTQVVVRNLSMGGAYVIGFAAPDKRIPEEFRLTVQAGSEGPGFETTCQLIHMRRESDQTLALGCRFTRVDPARLQTYLT